MAMTLLNDSLEGDNITGGNASDLPASQSTSDSGPTGWKISSPFIIIFGTFGNIMVFVVLHDRSVTHPSMAVYLRLLAVSDLIAIFDNVMLRWIRFQFGFDVWVVHETICKLSLWALWSCSTLSTWTLVVMVTQRAVSIVWPHKVNSLNSKHLTFVAVMLLIIFSTATNSLFLYFSTIIEMKVEDVVMWKSCNANYDDEVTTTVFKVWVWINTITTSCLPFIILLVDDIILIRRVVTSTREARDHLAVGSTQQVKVREKKAVSMTVTLIVTSLTFFLLTFPSCAFTVTQLVLIDNAFSDKNLFELLDLVWGVVTPLWCSSHAVNFYLYCLTGARFRARTKHILCWCRGSPWCTGSCSLYEAPIDERWVKQTTVNSEENF